LGTSESVISGKIIQKWLFQVIWREKISFQNYRISGTELASFLEKKSRRLFYAELPTTAVLTRIDSVTMILKLIEFFSKNDAGSVPKKISFLKIMILYS